MTDKWTTEPFNGTRRKGVWVILYDGKLATFANSQEEAEQFIEERRKPVDTTNALDVDLSEVNRLI